MMNAHFDDCPSSDDLKRFITGRFDVAATEQIASHIEACPNCQTRIEQLDDTDASVDAAVGAPNTIAFTDESHCGRVLGAIASGNKSASPPDHPQQLGDYTLLEPLGQGGMGTVYRARHAELGTLSAVKILQPHRSADQATINRFEREMVAIGKLDHPNIVRALDAGEDAGQQYLVMEYVNGFDLNRVASASESLSVADVAEVVRQAATGLSYVHRHGRVHRDIKPSNLILAHDGTVKLMDLGLARVEEYPVEEATTDVDDILGGSTIDLTRTHQVMGTPEYMPPEQVTDSSHVDHRADIYSLGCTFYKLLTGQSPMASSGSVTSLPQLMQRVQSPTIPVRVKRPDVPRALSDLIDRMLAKSPADRPQSAEEIATLLRPFASGAHLSELATRTQKNLALANSHALTTGDLSIGNDGDSAIFETTPYEPRLNTNAKLTLAGAAALLVLVATAVIFSQSYFAKGAVTVLTDSPDVAVLLASGNARFVDGTQEVPIKLGQTELPIGQYVISTNADSRLKFSQNLINIERDEHFVLSVTSSSRDLAKEVSLGQDEALEATNAPEPNAVVAIEQLSTYEPIDLISLIDPERDIRANDWRLVDGALVSTTDQRSTLMIPYQPPDHYRVELTAMRLKYDESLALGLVADNREILLVIDTYPWLGFLSGINQLDGVEISRRSSGSHQGQLLPLGQPVPIVATLRRDGQRLSIDMMVGGSQVLSWRGNVSQATNAGGYLTQPGLLFLAVFTASIKVSDFQVVPLDGEGTVVSFTDPSTNPQRAAVERVLWHGGVVSIVDHAGTPARTPPTRPLKFNIADRPSTQQPSPPQRPTTRIDRRSQIPEAPRVTAIDAQASSWFDDRDLPPLANFPELESLDLSSTRVSETGIEQLGVLPNLTSLSLAGTLLRDVPLELPAICPALKSLDLQNTLISDSSVAAVNGFAHLTELSLGGTGITQDGLSQLDALAELESLSLAGTTICQLDQLTSSRFPRLKRLNLLGTLTSRDELDAVRERMPELEVISGRDPGDLIALIDVQRDADARFSQGRVWQKENGRLITAEQSRITLPIVLPAEFDLHMTASRIAEGNAPIIGFTRPGGRHFAVGFDHDPELGYYTTLHGIDGKVDQLSPVKVQGESFPLGAEGPTEIEIRVRNRDKIADIQVLRNGTEVLRWQGDEARLHQLFSFWKGPNPTQSWMAQRDGSVVIEKLTVEPVSGPLNAGRAEEVSRFADLPVLNLDFRNREIDDIQLKELLKDRVPTHLTLYGPGITDASIDVIAANRQLRLLSLHSTGISESAIAQLADLPCLEGIEFWEMTQITDEVTKYLAPMPSLNHVVFKNCSFCAPGLERLHGRPITGMGLDNPGVNSEVLERYVLPFKKLRTLDLAGSPIDDDAMALFPRFTDLTLLHLGWNQTWQGPGLENLKQIPSLRQLYLDSSAVNDRSLGHLAGTTQIRGLSLRKTGLGDDSVETIVTLTGLEWLNLTETNFTTAGVERLKALMPQVDIHFDGGRKK